MQYRNKPRARATIGRLVDAFNLNDLFKNILEAYDIDTAIGKQLDVIGAYQGCKREIAGPEGIITLDDNSYRILIKLYAVRNNLGASLYDIEQLLFNFFGTSIRVFDHKNMRLSYYVDTNLIVNDNLAYAFLNKNLLPYPNGVGGIAIYHDRLNNFFGMQSYDKQTYVNTPMNSYDDYRINRPWLSYRYAEEINVAPPLPPEQGFLETDDNFIIIQDNGYYIIV